MESNHVTDFLDFLPLVSPGTDDVNVGIPRKVLTPLVWSGSQEKSPMGQTMQGVGGHEAVS